MAKDKEEKVHNLTDSLDDDDWALVIGSNGDLKGIFIPECADEDAVPSEIVEIMEKFYGMDFKEIDDEDSDDSDDDTPQVVH